MIRVLITGMSAVGKSTVARRLTDLGFKAVDVDYGGYSESVEGGDQHWNVARISELLATEDADVLFVVGCDDAQVHFYPQFDHIVPLSVSREIMLERLATRTNNPFGKTARQRAKILNDLDVYEPILRESATLEVDTSQPIDRVVEEILGVLDRS
jgi:dephospho-CoA kinase